MPAPGDSTSDGGRSLTQVFLGGDPSAWLGWDPKPWTLDDVLAAWRSTLARRATGASPRTLRWYAHFAFCEMSCRFCQYWHVVPRDATQWDLYADHMVALVERYHAALGTLEVSSAYLGGGTPTALPATCLARCFAAFRRAVRVAGEYTCEAHPATLDAEKLDLLCEAGVNRLSMGVQSFDAAVLRSVGRTNAPRDDIARRIADAQRRGLAVNVDLILGLPEQTRASFEHDLWALVAAGADFVTLYRYQPVARLPARNDGALRFRSVITPELRQRALARGYLLRGADTDEDVSATLFRVSPRVLRWLLANATSVLLGRLHGREDRWQYQLFDDTAAHLLGLGPGAISHLYGRGWLRDVTSVSQLSTGATASYWGTALTSDDECRTTALIALQRGQWVDPVALGHASGTEGARAVLPVLEEALRTGVAEVRRGRYRLRRECTVAAREAALAPLLPPTDPNATRERHRRTLRFKLRRDVQSELVEGLAGGEAMLEEVALEEHERSDLPSPTLLEWCRLLGVPAAGQRFADAVVERVEGSEVAFRVPDTASRVLRVVVQRAGAQRAFCRTRRFAVFHRTLPDDESLSSEEERFLRELCARTRRADEA